jgi:hypothetical protein
MPSLSQDNERFLIRKGQLHGIKRGNIVAQNLIIATVFGIDA